MNCRVLMAAVAAMMIVILAAGPAMAQPVAAPTAPLADKLPGGSLVYLGWGGIAPNKAALDKTGMGMLMNDPEVKPYVDDLWAQFETFAKKTAEGKLPPGTFEPIRTLVLDLAVNRPWAVSLMDLKLPEAGEKSFSVSAVFLADLGDKPEPIVASMNALLEKLLSRPRCRRASRPSRSRGRR